MQKMEIQRMKTKKLIIVITTIAVVAAICVVSSNYNFSYFFAEMVYGGENGIESNIIFSKQSGFYEEEFQLKIYAPSDEIYYRLDGSEPNRESLRYDAPILIDDATKNENVYSLRTDVCGSFIAGDTLYTIPDYLVDKCTVIKVAYYDETGNLSAAETRNYFVNYDEKAGYENISIISVTTDSENLFSDDKGIYVLGDSFKEYCEENDLSTKSYYRWGANFLNRGREWERNVNIQVFDENKELVLSQNVGMRIQGGVSRGLLPKSLNFYARDEYGDNRMKYDFFDTGYYPQRVTLSGGGNDYYSKMLDKLGAELTEDLEFCKMTFKPYALFLNGEYWGFYHLTEKYDEHYIEHYYDVESDHVIIIKNGNLEVGTEEDYIAYIQMREFVENADMSLEENYQKACELLDINSFIDYFAAEIYMARQVDWPSSNYALWRSRECSNKKYGDGKWRWMLFDVNTAAFLDAYVDHDTLTYVRNESKMFDNLYNNQEFKNTFNRRLLEMSDTIFKPSIVEQTVNEYIQLMSEPMNNNHKRFFNTDNSVFTNRADEMLEFAKQRKLYVEAMIGKNPEILATMWSE